MTPLFANITPFSSSLGGPTLVIVIVIRSHYPHSTRRPLMHMGCRRNVALPPAQVSPPSVGWDAIHPPRSRRRCSRRTAISTVAHPRYPPDAGPGHAVHVLLLPYSIVVVVVPRPHEYVDVTCLTAAIIVHITVLQCIARRCLLPSQCWVIVVWSLSCHRRLPTDGGGK